MMSTDAENIRVVVRCRPLSEKEQAAGCQDIVAVDTVQGTVLVTNPNGAQGDVPPKMFTFDTVFDTNSKQVEVYNQAARPIVENVLEGYNGADDSTPEDDSSEEASGGDDSSDKKDKRKRKKGL
ncbi:hypothetical protein V5799_013740 [Amblyomma americanum]|uniref:Kinesin motor domain-containing protein n=1 Tax=Amblyomma americanum TaxID=6943 RepID=A0AAQ4E509_AMBAM